MSLSALSELETPTVVITYSLVPDCMRSLAYKALAILLTLAEQALASLSEYCCNISFGVAKQNNKFHNVHVHQLLIKIHFSYSCPVPLIIQEICLTRIFFIYNTCIVN